VFVVNHYTGSIGPSASGRWFAHSFPASWHVIWYVIPTTVQAGNPSIDWDVAVERADTNYCTYWITIKNLTAQNQGFEMRYAVLN
jgi:hypothetical protein